MTEENQRIRDIASYERLLKANLPRCCRCEKEIQEEDEYEFVGGEPSHFNCIDPQERDD